MTIPTVFLDELRARTSLSTLVGRSVAIKKAGREWKACCPFHSESTPSFYVNDEKGFYHCFGCEAHGDAIGWLIEQQGMQFIDAVKELAEQAGLQVPAQDPAAAQKAKRRDSFTEINARAAAFFVNVLDPAPGDLDATAAVQYLVGRGIDVATADKFQIGFAPHSRPGTASPIIGHMKGVDVADLEQLGLVKRNPDSKQAYDFFRRRIIIPIHDARGAVIGFGGRALGDGQPNTLNSPDTPVFDKGRTLFNLHRAAPAARAKGRLVIVEGYMDVIGVDSVGFDTAVAPNGTALTEHHLFLAWKLVDAPVVCFDGDNAGRKAAARAAYRALPIMEPGKTLRFAMLPAGQDPDDLARSRGLEAFNAIVDAAMSLVDVVWRDLNERFDTTDADQRAALAAEVRTILGTIRNADVRRSYQESFTGLYQAAGRRTRAAAPTNHEARGRGRNVTMAIEGALALGLVDQPEIFEDHGEDVARLPWRMEDNRRLVHAIHAAVYRNSEGPTDRALALAAIERAGMSDYLAELRSVAIRMPFSAHPDPARGRSMLLDALRENFT